MTATVSETEEGAAHFAAFLRHLTTVRQLSAHTVSNYARDIAALLEASRGQALADLRLHDMRRFIAQFHARGLGGKSLARRLSAWRGLFGYLVRDHGFSHNPCAGLRAPKSAKALPNVLSPDAAVQLVSITADTPLAVRDKAIFELAYSSGLRLSELTSLTLDALDADRTVRVTGKGNKTRIVPVGSFALSALSHWLQCRALIAAPDQTALFVNAKGARLSGRAIQYRIKHWARKQGVTSDVHPHVLRHSFASHVLQSSGDLRAVQEMLGHASISSTQIYTHLDFQYLAKAYDQAHPRAKKKP